MQKKLKQDIDADNLKKYWNKKYFDFDFGHEKINIKITHDQNVFTFVMGFWIGLLQFKLSFKISVIFQLSVAFHSI